MDNVLESNVSIGEGDQLFPQNSTTNEKNENLRLQSPFNNSAHGEESGFYEPLSLQRLPFPDQVNGSRNNDIGPEGDMEKNNQTGDLAELRQLCSSQAQELTQLREVLRHLDSRFTDAEAEVVRLRNALVVAEKACCRQSTLLSRSLVDREVIASEARACEQELSEVETKIHQLTADILAKDSRISQLEEEIAEYRNAEEETETKIRQMSTVFEEVIREQAEQLSIEFQSEIEGTELNKVESLEKEIEKLKASHAEALEASFRQAEAKANTDAQMIEQLRQELNRALSQSESQRVQLDSLKTRNDQEEASRESLKQIIQSTRTRLAQMDAELARERTKSAEVETELATCRKALTSAKRALHEVSLERDIAQERIVASAKHFEEMHTQIMELNSSLQESSKQITSLQTKIEERDRSNDLLERKREQAEKEILKVNDCIRRLEEDREAFVTTNQQLERSVVKLRSSYAKSEEQRINKDLEVEKLKNLLNKLEKEREAGKMALNEGLRVAAIPISKCVESCDAEDTEVNVNSQQKIFSKKRSVLNVVKAAELLVSKIVTVGEENNRLNSRLATQEEQLAEQCSQMTTLNDNLLQLEAHLSRVREENKRLSLEQALLKRQLESQKCTTAKYRQAKQILQEKLSKCELLHKNISTFGRCPNLDKSSNVRKCPSSSQLAELTSTIVARCVDKEGQLCTDAFRAHLRKALGISRDSTRPSRSTHEGSDCATENEVFAAPNFDDDGGAK